jgi:hypothetical protein
VKGTSQGGATFTRSSVGDGFGSSGNARVRPDEIPRFRLKKAVEDELEKLKKKRESKPAVVTHPNVVIKGLCIADIAKKLPADVTIPEQRELLTSLGRAHHSRGFYYTLRRWYLQNGSFSLSQIRALQQCAKKTLWIIKAKREGKWRDPQD